jgi:hypothetical protein
VGERLLAPLHCIAVEIARSISSPHQLSTTMTKKTENQNKDLESALHDAHLYNDTVDSISWSGINVHLKDKATKAQKYLIQGLSGDVKAGTNFLHASVHCDSEVEAVLI